MSLFRELRYICLLLFALGPLEFSESAHLTFPGLCNKENYNILRNAKGLSMDFLPPNSLTLIFMSILQNREMLKTLKVRLSMDSLPPHMFDTKFYNVGT